MASHGDKEPVAVLVEVPWAIETAIDSRPAFTSVPPVLLASPRNRPDSLRAEVELADAVVLAIGHVKDCAVDGHPLGVIELGGREGAVLAAGHPVPRDSNLVPLEISNDDPVVRTIGDEQAIALRIGQHLAGEIERGIDFVS